MNTSALEPPTSLVSTSARVNLFGFVWPGAVAWLALLSLLGGCGGADEAGPSASLRVVEATPEKLNESASQASNQAARRQVRSGEMRGVTALALSRDHTSVGVANADGQVVLLNSAGQEIKQLRGTGGSATVGLVFSANDRYVVAVSRDSSATAWNVETGERRFSLSGHAHGLRSLSASADGSLIATGGEETRVMLWDGSTGRLTQILRGATDFVNSVSVSADARQVASGDANATVMVWSVATGKVLHTLRGHHGEVNAVLFSANGKWLASADQAGKVLVWDLTNGSNQSGLNSQALVGQPLVGQQTAVRSLAFDADGGLLASGAVDGKVVVWDLATRIELPSVQSWRVSVGAGAGAGAGAAPTPQATARNGVNAMAFTIGAAGTASQLMVGNDDSHVRSLSLPTSVRR